MSRHRLARTLLALILASVVIACSEEDRQPARSAAPSATLEDPPAETLTALLQQPLPNAEDRTFTSAIVDFPPGARAVPHRHGSAFVYAYVLDGSVRSRLAGQPEQTYREGGNWVEEPGADHLLTENVSTTEPARLLVVFISTTGHRLKIDDRRPATR
jgi:quercetin dioxygenase-like cupin family protein